MSDAVLDSSAVLALLQDEAGADQVSALLPGALLSTVNLVEVIAKLCDRMTVGAARMIVEELGAQVIDFDLEQACLAGDLRKRTKAAGLSLGDRACLALANLRKLPAVTADTAWQKIPGLDIILIRGGMG